VSTPRFEYKYRLTLGAYWRIRAHLPVGFRLDQFSRAAPKGRYLVRSVYYDTWDFRDYFEKVTGVGERRKLRVRTYWDTLDEAAFVSVEEKKRIGDLIEKHTERIPVARYQRFYSEGQWGAGSTPLEQRFEAVKRLDDLRPSVLVAYRREVHEARDGSGIRISLDHDVRYARARYLFAPSSLLRSDLGRMVIMEIKTSDTTNPLLQTLVRAHDLKAEPNSKYANAIEQTQQPIWY